MDGAGFALLTSTLGLLLCSAQTFKGHIDARHERDRMQEMHEQKMHYLHEFHRREIHARDARLGLLEEERKRYVFSYRLARGGCMGLMSLGGIGLVDAWMRRGGCGCCLRLRGRRVGMRRG